MQKNTAGQTIGVQMVSATDGTGFTGTVTIYITGDGGTQTLGSVGSGICTHKGGGYHVYSPSQAETNYALLAFTFTGSGAVPTTIQIFTRMDTNLLAINGQSGGVAGFDRATRAIVLGTVTTGSTATSIVTSSLSPAATAADQFKGLIVAFDSTTTTANLRGQKTNITGSTSGGVLTVTALTDAPVSGDTFVIE